MKFATVLVGLLVVQAMGSPIREKRQYLSDLGNPFVAAALLFGYAGVQFGKGVANLAGSVKDFILHPVNSTITLTDKKLHDIVSYALDVAQDNKLFADHENVAISITFDSTWHHPNDIDLKNDQHIDWLKFNGDENTAAQYKKALKEILALKQSGTSNIKCLLKLHEATIDFLAGNKIVSSTGGLALKKVTDDLKDLKNEITGHMG